MRILVMLALAATTAAAQSDQPLTARLLPPDRGRPTFNVSDQAYVAIFALQRSNTRSLVYYASATPGEHATAASFVTRANYTGEPLVTTLIMVASRQPLDVSRVRDSVIAPGDDADATAQRIAREISSPGATVAVDSYLVRQ